MRELDLLPAAQLFAQPLVPPRARRLALQRAALLLDLEDDVVDARQVLLRGFELELGGAAARLVLGDAGRFFDQRAALGRARRQDLADLALLDDGVRLDAEARVHQQVVDVAQPADLAVDQVLALAGSVQPAADLDVARDERLLVEQLVDGPSTTVAAAIAACATSVSFSRTSAAAVGLRASLPLKITSSMRSPRRLLALCSPSTHVMASTTLLLPQPFGPTMAVTPSSNPSSARSGKLLKPLMCSFDKRMEVHKAAAPVDETIDPAAAGNAFR